MSDLVERLRAEAALYGVPTTDSVLELEAADEITRLRAEVQAKEDRIAGLVNLLQAVSSAGVVSSAKAETLRADAAAAVLAERLACAAVARGAQHLPNNGQEFANGWTSAVLQIAQAIESRS
jgi:hypothetical protein